MNHSDPKPEFCDDIQLPFKITTTAKNWCLQPKRNKLNSPIVMRSCKDKSLQRWTVDWMGQYRNVRDPKKCLKVKGNEIILHWCSDSYQPNLWTNFIMSAHHGTILWMNDPMKGLTLERENKRRVTMHGVLNPKLRTTNRQTWSIKYDM